MNRIIIDYYSGIQRDFDVNKLNYSITSSHQWEQVPSKNGYTHCFLHANGMLRMYHPKRPDMGCMYTISAKCLQSLSDTYNLTRLNALKWVGATTLKCNRIDLTADITLPHGELERMVEYCKVLNQGRQRNIYTAINSPGIDAGTTIYRGKRTSPKFLRFYDSALMHNLPEGTIRMELELKGSYAKYAWDTLQASTTPLEWVRGILASQNEFPVLVEPLGKVTEFDMASSEESVSTVKEWLSRQVIGILARDISSPSSERLLQYVLEQCLRRYGIYPDGLIEALDAITAEILTQSE